MDLFRLISALLLSFLPVFFWMIVLNRKHRNGMHFFFGINFVLAALFSAVFHHFLEFRIENIIQGDLSFGFRVFASYLLMGICIEYGKNFIVRLTGHRYFRSIDDVLDLSFATALGFTFYQNFFHFHQVFAGDFPDIAGPVKILKEVIQSTFYILPIHLFCSGFFGYFYGLALFATDKLKDQDAAHSRVRLLGHKTAKIIEGTFVSVLFYGVFFTILKLDPSIGDMMEILGFNRPILFGTEIDEKLMPLFSFFFFGLGTIILFQLLDKKREFSQKKLLLEKNKTS